MTRSDLASAIIERCFASRSGALCLGGILARDLVGEFGTPLYVYDGTVLDRAWTRLRAAFPARFDILYSIKANPLEHVARYVLSHEGGLEIASGGELGRARDWGCPP